jgi:hypothetical protein
MNLIKLLIAPVVLAAAVVEDVVTFVPKSMSDPNAESATMKAARFLAQEKP